MKVIIFFLHFFFFSFRQTHIKGPPYFRSIVIVFFSFLLVPLVVLAVAALLGHAGLGGPAATGFFKDVVAGRGFGRLFRLSRLRYTTTTSSGLSSADSRGMPSSDSDRTVYDTGRMPLYWYSEPVSSSQDVARLLLKGDPPGSSSKAVAPFAVAASSQSAGRGTSSRNWVSPTGKMSVDPLFSPSGAPAFHPPPSLSPSYFWCASSGSPDFLF